MNKTLRQFLAITTAFLLLAFQAPQTLIQTAHAQALNSLSGNLTASSTDCSAANACVILLLPNGTASATIGLSGTFSGTVQFEATNAATPATSTFIAIAGFPAGQTASVTSSTSTGLWTFDATGLTALRARVSSYSSGAITANITSSAVRSLVTNNSNPQGLSTTSTPTFAGVNETTGTQFNAVTSKIFLAADFTTSGSGTNLEQTGLSWTLPATTVVTVGFECAGTYSQAVGAVAVTFGIQSSQAPTNMTAQGFMGTTNGTSSATGGVAAITTATSTGIVTGTPNATATNYAWGLIGYIENPSQAANVLTINVKTATAADLVTVRRGSFCTLQF